MDPTKEQIETLYENLLSKLTFRKIKGIMALLLMAGSFAIFIVFAPLVDEYEPLPEAENKELSELEFRPIRLTLAATVIGMLLGGLFLYVQSIKPIFDKQQKLFFEFYYTYVVLQKYLDLKGNKERKKAKKRINDLIYHIENWIDVRAPGIFSELPDSIKENLNKNLLPLIENKELNAIRIPNEEIKKLAYTIYNKDPSENELRKLNGILASLPTVSKEKPIIPKEKPKMIEQRRALQNFKQTFSISSVLTILIFTGAVLLKVEWGIAFLSSIGIGAVIFFGLKKKI